MAVARKCDRCGKFYDHYPIGDVPGVYNAVRRYRKCSETTQQSFETNIKDLCPECMEAFDKFMRMENVDE